MAKQILGGGIAPEFWNRLMDLNFSYIQCILEIVDNSIDAGASKFYIINYQKDGLKYLLFVDNGKGMNSETVKRYLTLSAEKTEDEKNGNPIGSKGMGGKISTITLTNRGDFTLITRDSIDNWVETNHNWKEEFFNKVIINAEPTVRNQKFVNHVFDNILKVPIFETFTILSLCISEKTFNQLFNQKENKSLDLSISFRLGVSYYQFIDNGFEIFLQQDEDFYKIKPVYPLRLDKKIFFPDVIPKNEISKIKGQEVGGPDYMTYYSNVDYYFQKTFYISMNNIVYEFENDYLYEYTGITGKNSSTSGARFTSKTKSNKSLNQIKSSCLEFLLEYSFSSDWKKLFKDLIKDDRFDCDEETILEYFYGLHFIRNDKYISKPVIKHTVKKHGDFHKRIWENGQFFIKFQSINHETDRNFGIGINKSAIINNDKDSSEALVTIKLLINFLKHDVKCIFDNDLKQKANKIKEPTSETKLINSPVKSSNSQVEPVIQSIVSNDSVINLESPPSYIPKELAIYDSPKSQTSDKTKEEKIQPKMPKMTRRSFKKNTINQRKQEKGEVCDITHIPDSIFTPTEKDHKDEKRNNNSEENLLVLNHTLHHIKTYKEEEYRKIVDKPNGPEKFMVKMIYQICQSDKLSVYFREKGKIAIKTQIEELYKSISE